MKQRRDPYLLVLLALVACSSTVRAEHSTAPTPAIPSVAAAGPIDAGRYLVIVGGCNDCHTMGWAESGGATPETDWLTGVPVGFRGPWGTTYASNLRLLVGSIDENAWVIMLRERKGLPPMPWMNVNRLNPEDARAMYRYIRSLGAAGTRMPTGIAAGVEPATPYIDLEPQHMERLRAPAATARQAGE